MRKFTGFNESLLRTYTELPEGQNPSEVRNIEKRQETIDLLERIYVEHEAFKVAVPVNRSIRKNAKLMSMSNQLFDLLDEHFMPTVPPAVDDMVIEIYHILRHIGKVDLDDSLWMECYNSGFAILIIRHALKYYELPIIQAGKWKSFAVNYTGLVMAA